jgi:hypothetical protein
MEAQQIQEPLYITNTQIKELLNISDTTLWRLTKEHGLPSTIRGMRSNRPYAAFKAWAIQQGMITQGQAIQLK